MLGEESDSATYWKQCGDEALANGIKGVVMMVRIPSSQPEHQELTKTSGCPLGLSERQDSGRNKSKSQQKPSGIRSSFKVCRL